jgi:Pyruvate/2-oxoacid:ferredoxin oxidoreductase gamma subunit
MEREILLTGIGGQGVQLAANVLAHAALDEGRDVQLFGSYGGMMRGGNTDAELVVDVAAADLAVEAGHVMAVSMVMLGALCTLTSLVGPDELRAAVRVCVPPYRQQHLELNDRALRAGAAAVSAAPGREAWPVVATAGSERS